MPPKSKQPVNYDLYDDSEDERDQDFVPGQEQEDEFETEDEAEDESDEAEGDEEEEEEEEEEEPKVQQPKLQAQKKAPLAKPSKASVPQNKKPKAAPKKIKQKKTKAVPYNEEDYAEDDENQYGGEAEEEDAGGHVAKDEQKVVDLLFQIWRSNKLTPKQTEAILRKGSEKKQGRKKRDPSQPATRPCSGFIQFSKENRPKFALNIKDPKEVVKKLGAEWHTLTASQQGQYTQTAISDWETLTGQKWETKAKKNAATKKKKVTPARAEDEDKNEEVRIKASSKKHPKASPASSVKSTPSFSSSFGTPMIVSKTSKGGFKASSGYKATPFVQS